MYACVISNIISLPKGGMDVVSAPFREAQAVYMSLSSRPTEQIILSLFNILAFSVSVLLITAFDKSGVLPFNASALMTLRTWKVTLSESVGIGILSQSFYESFNLLRPVTFP
jgi:hypothetical protein